MTMIVPIIDQLLVPGIFGVEQFRPFTGQLTPGEEAGLSPLVSEKRRLEFTAGRTCARAALESLGASYSSILKGSAREPIWPYGIVGSITHCDEYCAAAVTSQHLFRSIGIDAESNYALPLDVLPIVSSAEERSHLSSLPPGINWDRLLFSAKESLFKAWSPLTKLWLDFSEVAITFSPGHGSFIAHISRKHIDFPECVQGRYLFAHEVLLTTVFLRHD